YEARGSATSDPRAARAPCCLVREPGARRRSRCEASVECEPWSCVRWPPCAEFDVVDVLGDRRVLAADRAARVAAEGDRVEVCRQGIEEERPSDERLADAHAELERLVRLERADDPRQDAEHAAFGAARCELRRGRGGEEAAVARSVVGSEDGDLPLEAEDR